MKAIIVDDERDARDLLNRFVNKFCKGVEVVRSFESPIKAYNFLNSNHEEVDLIYLDISMPEMDGLTFLRQCSDFDVKVIFITAFDDYAIQAIRLAALDYILKPINIDLLVAATERARKQLSTKKQVEGFIENFDKPEKDKKVMLNNGSEILFTPVNDIIHLSADGNYTHLFIQGQDKLLITETLGHFEELLKYYFMYRVHRGHLINLHHVTKYLKGRGGEVVMSNGEIIPVAQRSKTDFLKKLSML